MDLATTRPDFPPAAPSRAWMGSSLRARWLKDVFPLLAVFVLALAAAIAPAPAGAAEFFLADEPEVYAAIDKLAGVPVPVASDGVPLIRPLSAVGNG